MSDVVTGKYLADLIAVDVRTIQNYAERAAKAGMNFRLSRGKYDFKKFVKWLYKSFNEEIEILKSAGNEELHNLKMTGQDIRNKREEIALKRDLSQLLDKKTTLITTTNLMGVVKTALDTLENNLKRDLKGVMDEKKINKLITTGVTSAKETVAGMDIEQFLTDEDKLFEPDDE